MSIFSIIQKARPEEIEEDKSEDFFVKEETPVLTRYIERKAKRLLGKRKVNGSF